MRKKKRQALVPTPSQILFEKKFYSSQAAKKEKKKKDVKYARTVREKKLN